MILRSPEEFSHKQGQKAKIAASKLAKHQVLWDLAKQAIQSVDKEFATVYTAVAFTHNFIGSPHIDTQNIGPFYGMSFGNFVGGELCVEAGPLEVCRINTKNRAVKVDGRYPHWVAPFTLLPSPACPAEAAADAAASDSCSSSKVSSSSPLKAAGPLAAANTPHRFSVIFYQTLGEVTPRGPAVFI